MQGIFLIWAGLHQFRRLQAIVPTKQIARIPCNVKQGISASLWWACRLFRATSKEFIGYPRPDRSHGRLAPDAF